MVNLCQAIHIWSLVSFSKLLILACFLDSQGMGWGGSNNVYTESINVRWFPFTFWLILDVLACYPMQMAYTYHSLKFSICRISSSVSVPKTEDLFTSFQMAEMLNCLCPLWLPFVVPLLQDWSALQISLVFQKGQLHRWFFTCHV